MPKSAQFMDDVNVYFWYKSVIQKINLYSFGYFYWVILPIASDTQLSLLPCRGMIPLMKRGAKKFKTNDL